MKDDFGWAGDELFLRHNQEDWLENRRFFSTLEDPLEVPEDEDGEDWDDSDQDADWWDEDEISEELWEDDAWADGDALRSAGWGMDEEYEHYDCYENEGWI